MPANRVPDSNVPLSDVKGNVNPTWWRFFARIASQFSGIDAPVMPPDVAGILSAANTQAKPHGLSEAQIQQIAQQVFSMLPRPAGKDREAADNALIALGNRAAGSNRETGALDLASIALSRIRPQSPTAPQIVVCTQATFPTLTSGTAALFIYVSDFAHWIYWDGTTPTFADGGSDYYIVAPSAPSTIGWHAVDGSTINYLNADGTLSAKTLVNAAGTPAYLKVGSGGDTLNAPIAPTISGHTELAATGIAVSGAAAASAGVASINNPASGTATNVLVPPFSGGGGGGGVTDPQHQHNLTAANAPISNTGEPENFYSKLWFRL
jgi:hypothetical protein